MFIPGLGAGIPGLLGDSLNVGSARRASPVTRPSGLKAHGLQDLARRLADLREGLEGLKLAASTRRIDGSRAVQPLGPLSSAAPLGLVTEPTFASLASSEEVNATPTSYGPFQPQINGSSTSVPTFTGVYDGSYGDDRLLFEVRRDATIGQDRIRIRIRDSQGNTLENLNVNDYQAGDPIQLDSGLVLRLSAGDIEKNDTFELDVFATVGSVVDPTKAFDGTGNDRPNFEEGLGVVAGSFEINGVSIAVAANDTILSVLDTINASGAGVVASFDAATEQVVLTHEEAGSGGEIVLGADSSGFLAATKLSNTSFVAGLDPDVERPIGDVAALSGITDGEFAIDGRVFTIDTSVDTLQDVLDRITAAGVGIEAEFDPLANRVVLTPHGRTLLELDDGTSGFFSAVGIEATRYGTNASPRATAPAVEFASGSRLRLALGDFGQELTALFRETFEGLALAEVSALREVLQSTLEDVFSQKLDIEPRGDRLRSGLGLDLDFGEDARLLFSVDQGALGRAFTKRGSELEEFLLAPVKGRLAGGVLVALDDVLAKAQESVLERLVATGATGAFLDFLA